MKRRLTVAIACLSIVFAALVLGRSQGWQFIASVFSADRAKFNKASAQPDRIWIRRHTFAASPVAKHPSSPNVATQQKSAERTRYQLPVDLAQRLRELGALELSVAPVAGAPGVIYCRCQVEVPGTPYLRRFECRDESVELAGRGLLLQIERWKR